MEPMVLGALGIVLYCGYLTVQELLADLRKEGLLNGSRLGRGLTREWSQRVMGFVNAKGGLQRDRRICNSFACTPVLVRANQHYPAEGRLPRTDWR